jgi:hypothetical protein
MVPPVARITMFGFPGSLLLLLVLLLFEVCAEAVVAITTDIAIKPRIRAFMTDLLRRVNEFI